MNMKTKEQNDVIKKAINAVPGADDMRQTMLTPPGRLRVECAGEFVEMADFHAPTTITLRMALFLIAGVLPTSAALKVIGLVNTAMTKYKHADGENGSPPVAQDETKPGEQAADKLDIPEYFVQWFEDFGRYEKKGEPLAWADALETAFRAHCMEDIVTDESE